MTGYDMVGAIIDYECGDITEDDALELFQVLVDTGTAWTLQGHYGRTARALLDAGFLDPAPMADLTG